MAVVKSVTQLPNGDVTVTYVDAPPKTVPANQATDEINKARLAGTYMQNSQSSAAFGTSPQTGSTTNNSTGVVWEFAALRAFKYLPSISQSPQIVLDYRSQEI